MPLEEKDVRYVAELAHLELTAEEVARLDAVSELPPEYPGWMFERQGGARRPAPFKVKA